MHTHTHGVVYKWMFCWGGETVLFKKNSILGFFESGVHIGSSPILLIVITFNVRFSLRRMEGKEHLTGL